ncbi:MAG: hypothetical protein J6D28_02600 [Bacilli bacterium]|nr:hypothetical protein [Bacilli bacterium]
MIIFSNEEIENVNYAMVMALECANRLLNKEYVIEDGKITEIHINGNIIKGR